MKKAKHILRASLHEAGRQEQELRGRNLVGRSWSSFFRRGCGCLWPHHFEISATLTWLCPWKEKCAGGFSTEVTRNLGKKLSFCMTGQWRTVVTVASRDLKWFRTSPRQHTLPFLSVDCSYAANTPVLPRRPKE
jgi:hypothetical protein